MFLGLLGLLTKPKEAMAVALPRITCGVGDGSIVTLNWQEHRDGG